jgi:hypothetical protein
MWAHTLVNDFARGRWPTLDDIQSNSDNAVIPLRHKIVESYIGDATPGFDGNPERRPGDASDDVTPARSFAAPHRFLYETLIDPQAAMPSGDSRGAVIDFFLALRSTLVDLRDPAYVRPIDEAIEEYDRTREAWDRAEDDCNYGATSSGPADVLADIAHDTVACPIALAAIGVSATIDTFEAFLSLRQAARQEAARRVFHSYLDNWIEAIDAGLKQWSELSLAVLRAEFDPAARRAFQDRECARHGAEDNPARIQCEDAVSKLDVIFEETEEFTNRYLLAMLGLPQIVGKTREATDDIRDEVTAFLSNLAVPFDPILAPLGEIQGEARRRIREALRDATGVDLDEFERFKNPTHWLVDTAPVTVNFPVIGAQTVRLFLPGDHERLDLLMGFAGDDHHVHFGVPFQESTGLADHATFRTATFPPVANTIMNAKLLLLDAATLNRLLGDVLVDLGVLRDASAVATYRDGEQRPANLMVDSLDADGPAAWWLRDINSDHAWRGDAKPEAPDLPSGGTGGFPIWESCVLRPAFRALYQDWENGSEAFPDLGDAASPDPATDPEAPQTALRIEGDFFDDGERRYVSRSTRYELMIQDAVFASSALGLRYRIYTDPANPGPWLSAAPGTMLSISGPDGLYRIDYQGEDPCHTFAENDSLPAETIHRETFLLGRFGTGNRDALIGTAGDDVLVGMGGDDVLLGLGGNDHLQGGAGNDLLIGHEGNDLLLGFVGRDRLLGQHGDDGLDGGEDRDVLFGGPGRDELSGSGGDDQLGGGDGDDALDGGDGNDRLFGERGRNAAEGGSGKDWLFGGPESDSLRGGDGDDLLFGRAGDDSLQGEGGRDQLFGQAGDDVLEGGGGGDLLYGGPGRDACGAGAARTFQCEPAP